MTLSAIAVLALTAVLAGAAFLILWLDRFKGEPVVRLVLMAAWGAGCALALNLAAPAAASLGGSQVSWIASPATGAAVGVLQQLLLAGGLAILATSHYLDGPLDGAAYGTVTGLGFAAFKSAAALLGGAASASLGPAAAAVLGQAGATALVGGAFGFAKLALRAPLRVVAVFGAALVAGVYQSGITAAESWARHAWPRGARPFELALGVVSALLLVGVACAATAFERRVLERQLAEEVALAVVPEWVVRVIPWYRRRVRRDWWPRRDERREVVRLLTALAYRKQQLRGLPERRAELYGLEVGRLRQRARTLLALPPDGRGADEGGA